MAVVVDVAAAVRSDKPSRQMLAGRAGVMILLGVVDEVLPSEQAALGVGRCQGLWHTGQHASVLACQYLIAVEIAPISQNSDLLVSRHLLRPKRHRYELAPGSNPGGITIVKDYVRAQRLRHREVF